MKRIYLLLIVFFTCTANAASVFTQCINNFSSSTCNHGTINDYALQWTVTCGQTGIQGIAVCSTTSASTTGTTKTSINLSVAASGSGGVYCYCRLITPFVSSYWVYAKLNNTNNCTGSCAQHCAEYITSNSTFRNSILGTLEN